MTGVTTWNKGTAPSGSDGWNLRPDIQRAIESSNFPVPVSSKAERDALNPPGGKYPGMVVVRLDTPDSRHEVYDGANWDSANGTAYTPTWSSPGSFGSGGSVVGKYWLAGNLVTLRASITAGTGTSMPAGIVGFSLPTGLPMAAGLTNVGQALHKTDTGAIRPMVAICTPGQTVSVWAHQGAGVILNPGNAGFPWGANYSIEALIHYETTTIL